MHILIGLVLVLVLLYYWLLGHWFARVVTLILFVPLFALGGAALLASGAAPQASSGVAILGAICGSVAAWFVAGIPVYYWRARLKQLAG
jgi:hypothetical protein